MNDWSFRGVALVCALGLGLTPGGCGVTPAQPGVSSMTVAVADDGSRSMDFGANWKFARVDESVAESNGAYARAPDLEYDSTSWRTVDVPHDWSIELDPTTAHGTTSGTGFLPGGLGWYRKTFTLPRSMAGKRIAVEFDGVYMDASVYVNGQQIANHPYGYTGFQVDLTSLVHTDGKTPNLLAVKVQNQLPSSRWYSGSGIYRPVYLTVTDPIHVIRHGTFVTTPNLESTFRSGFAMVRVQTSAVNERGGTVPVRVVSTVEDATGRPVVSQESELALGTETGTSHTDLRVERPVLWSMEKPYLYTLRTELVAEGRVVDEVRTRFGIRWFAFSPTEGFSLNGAYAKLQGVNLHHDLGALGAATYRDAIVRQVEIMKSMGVNALRTSHNPPSREVIEVCEERGIVMMVEAFDTWRTPKVTYDYGRFFDQHSDADLREMVHAAKNSPAVVMWSIGNEVPDVASATVGVPIAKRLIETVKAIDQSRPIVIGSDRHRSVPAPGSGPDQILRMLDGLGVNYNSAASMDALHAHYPATFFLEAESSSATSTRGVYDSPEQLNTGENYTPGKRGTSSYDNNLERWTMSAEYALKKDRDRKFVAGQFLWSGIDYIGEPTPYDIFPVKTSFFGAVDTAGFPKDAYYLFKSQWTREPMVHLLPMNWTDHAPGEPVQVWAYSNVDTVELFLDGRSLGERRFDTKRTNYGKTYLETTEATGDDKTVTTGPYPGSYTSPNGSAGKLHLTWNVPFAPGTLMAVAKRDGRVVARDEVVTAMASDALELTPDKAVLERGTSLVFVTAKVVDAKGTMVPSADPPISFKVIGGKLLGLDNGQQESAENYQASSRRAFNGKALAIVKATGKGPVTVIATSPGLLSDATTVFPAGERGDRTAHDPAAAVEPARVRSPVQAAAESPSADASYSGARNTVPAAMLDGDASTGWSNYYLKAATALLPAISRAHPSDWVSLSWPRSQTLGAIQAHFAIDTAHALPVTIDVRYWNGSRFVPVKNLRIDWATQSQEPTTMTFEPVATRQLQLHMVSRYPNGPNGFLRINELRPLLAAPPAR